MNDGRDGAWHQTGLCITIDAPSPPLPPTSTRPALGATPGVYTKLMRPDNGTSGRKRACIIDDRGMTLMLLFPQRVGDWYGVEGGLDCVWL
jgi:hypothetical protein